MPIHKTRAVMKAIPKNYLSVKVCQPTLNDVGENGNTRRMNKEIDMEIRPECKSCNHLPVCADGFKMNISESCPYYESEKSHNTTIEQCAEACKLIAQECENNHNETGEIIALKCSARVLILRDSL